MTTQDHIAAIEKIILDHQKAHGFHSDFDFIGEHLKELSQYRLPSMEKLIEKLEATRYHNKWDNCQSGYDSGIDTAVQMIEEHLSSLPSPDNKGGKEESREPKFRLEYLAGTTISKGEVVPHWVACAEGFWNTCQENERRKVDIIASLPPLKEEESKEGKRIKDIRGTAVNRTKKFMKLSDQIKLIVRTNKGVESDLIRLKLEKQGIVCSIMEIELIKEIIYLESKSKLPILEKGDSIIIYGEHKTVMGFTAQWNDGLNEYEIILLTTGRADPFFRTYNSGAIELIKLNAGMGDNQTQTK